MNNRMKNIVVTVVLYILYIPLETLLDAYVNLSLLESFDIVEINALKRKILRTFH